MFVIILNVNWLNGLKFTAVTLTTSKIEIVEEFCSAIETCVSHKVSGDNVFLSIL